MKQLLTLFLIVFLFYPRSNESMTIVEPDHRIYYLKVKNINTENFNDYFNKMDVIGIYPKIKHTLKNKLNNYSYYKFKFYNMKSNIKQFKEHYVNILEELGFLSEAHKLKTNGIEIDTIKIYCKIEDIKAIFEEFEYCLTFDNLCHKI